MYILSTAISMYILFGKLYNISNEKNNIDGIMVMCAILECGTASFRHYPNPIKI